MCVGGYKGTFIFIEKLIACKNKKIRGSRNKNKKLDEVGIQKLKEVSVLDLNNSENIWK